MIIQTIIDDGNSQVELMKISNYDKNDCDCCEDDDDDDDTDDKDNDCCAVASSVGKTIQYGIPLVSDRVGLPSGVGVRGGIYFGHIPKETQTK